MCAHSMSTKRYQVLILHCVVKLSWITIGIMVRVSCKILFASSAPKEICINPALHSGVVIYNYGHYGSGDLSDCVHTSAPKEICLILHWIVVLSFITMGIMVGVTCKIVCSQHHRQQRLSSTLMLTCTTKDITVRVTCKTVH